MTAPPKFPQAAPYNAQRPPASARQHAAMVRIPGGTHTVGSPQRHPLANQAAMPEHRVAIRPFRSYDPTAATNAQFAEFLNALPVKPSGTALGGKVGAANIAPAERPRSLEFSSRPSPYTMIDLDDEDARIGVRDGRFVPRPRPKPPEPSGDRTDMGRRAAPRYPPGGVAPACRRKWSGRPRPGGLQGRPFPWVRRCPETAEAPPVHSSASRAGPPCRLAAGRAARPPKVCSIWRGSLLGRTQQHARPPLSVSRR